MLKSLEQRHRRTRRVAVWIVACAVVVGAVAAALAKTSGASLPVAAIVLFAATYATAMAGLVIGRSWIRRRGAQKP
jgi:hypothetical protein